MIAVAPGVMRHDDSQALSRWRTAVGLFARRNLGRTPAPKHTPVGIDLVFYIERPRTVDRASPAVPPDIDKLSRAILDALTNIAYVDDGQVVALSARKRYAADARQVGVVITVKRLDDAGDEQALPSPVPTIYL